jgi:DNA-binding transcriptional LysR family regulator
MIDLHDARIFLDILELGSFSAVARKRGVAATTLGRALDRLERSFALTLVHRTSRRLEPTSAGLAAAEQLAGLLRQAEDVLRGVGELKHRPRGTVRASVCSAYARRRLAAPIARFALANPDVAIDLVLEDRWLDLATEPVDLAVRTGRPPLSSGSVATVIGEHGHGVVAVARLAARVRRPEDLARVPLIVIRTETRWATWPFRRGDEEVVIRAQPAIEVSDVEMARALAVAGAGVVALPDYLAADDVASGALRPVLADWTLPAMPVVAIHPRRSRMTAAARALLDALATPVEGGRRRRARS